MDKDLGKSRDYGTLQQRLADLDITIHENRGGGFTVFTTCEPLFCFERATLVEIDSAVEHALASYVRTFYHVEVVHVTTKHVPLKEVSVPLEELTPHSRIKLGTDFLKKLPLSVE